MPSYLNVGEQISHPSKTTGKINAYTEHGQIFKKLD
jgi:hypothetical protein